MVDINLIGDDKTGEEKTGDEERVDEFSQTSSMDTEELAFEERTETFDTTKTDLTHKRGYSSLVSTLIIFGVIIVLGWAIYYFMFRGEETIEQTDLAQLLPETEAVEESTPTESEAQPLQTPEQGTETQAALVPEAVREPTPETRSEGSNIARPTPTVSENLTPVTSQFLSTSTTAIQTVTNLMTSMPLNLNTTLLSYAGQRVRFEFVAPSSAQAKDFTASLGQFFGRGKFSVLSESAVATNGQSMEKVLISGNIAQGEPPTQSGSIEFLNITQLKDWFQNISSQFGLQIRPLKTHQGIVADGYLKTPMLIRMSGNKAALLRFLEELQTQNLNVELTKILLVSPDMISYSDENLVLVLNLFHYQPS